MHHEIAIWSAAAAFFATVLAIGAIDILNPSDRLRFLSGVFVGLVTGGAVYARERLNDAKKEAEKYAGDIVVHESGKGKQYSLELGGDPAEVIDEKTEVVFKVVKRKP